MKNMRLQGQNFCLNNLTGLITMQETVWGKQKNQTQKKGFWQSNSHFYMFCFIIYKCPLKKVDTAPIYLKGSYILEARGVFE